MTFYQTLGSLAHPDTASRAVTPGGYGMAAKRLRLSREGVDIDGRWMPHSHSPSSLPATRACAEGRRLYIPIKVEPFMHEQFLIKNTTREQREQIVKDALSCGGGGCENCSACGAYGAIDPYDMYQPYVDGIKEIDQINQEFRTRYLL
jgi:hypothetical protein